MIDKDLTEKIVREFYCDWQSIAAHGEMTDVWAYFSRYLSKDCDHVWELRWEYWWNGTKKRLTNQCTKCYRCDTKGVKTPTDLSRYGEAVKLDTSLEIQIKRELQDQAVAVVRSRTDTSWNQYYQTPKWKDKRNKVMKRCGGICEGCLVRPATEVHHVTREHQGDELLYELRGLCRECHEKAEGKKFLDIYPPPYRGAQ